MCGIAGKISNDKTGNHIVVSKMCDKLQHRGPNAGMVKTLKNLALGHRRLSIIDLSDSANQPMVDETGRFWIVFNGEIYNFLEIKKELQKKNYQFITNSDTEVLLKAYKHWGKSCLSILNGMFSFAIWDEKEKHLFLARDRFGQKPLFYSLSSEGFSFASETKALLEDPMISNKTCLEAINCYLALGYILSPLSMYDDIRQLEAACYMYISADCKIIEKGEYWNYADKFREKTSLSEENISKRIYELLSISVKRRMISDVPVGAFLSGGLDSSSIVSIMKKNHKRQLHTFSVGFRQQSYNELPDADKVAHWAGTTHHGMIVDAKYNESFLHEAFNASDQLFSDNSIIPMIEVSKLASKNVTVVLSGDGADELFAGYITYSADRLLNKAKLIPKPLRHILSSNRIKLIPSNKRKINFDFKRQQFFYGSLFDYRKAHYLWRLIFNEEERIKILGEEYRELVYDTDPYKRFYGHYEKVSDLEKLDQHLYVDAKTWLTDDILYKVDRSTMNSSIEARCPYLDVELASFAASIPANLKMKHGEKKYILRKSLEGFLPRYIFTKRKSGFNAPINQWLSPYGKNEFQTYNKYVYDKAFGQK